MADLFFLSVESIQTGWLYSGLAAVHNDKTAFVVRSDALSSLLISTLETLSRKLSALVHSRETFAVHSEVLWLSPGEPLLVCTQQPYLPEVL